MIDGEFKDFSKEKFCYRMFDFEHCHTWFTDNGKNIHSKRFNKIHTDSNGDKYVNRFGIRFYLNNNKRRN